MPWNGSGTFNLASGNPVVSATTISSNWANTTLSDLASALNNVLCRDGQNQPTAAINWGAQNLTNVATFGAVTASFTTASISGNATIGGTATVSGALTANTTASITGNATIGGTATVSGALTANGLAYPSAGAQGIRNRLINSSAEVAQGSVVNISTSPQYGIVDMVTCWASGGTVSGGTITQDTSAPIGRKGTALKLAGVTLTGPGQLSWRYRMESADSLKLKNQTAILQIKVQHDVGSAINYTVVLRKPTAADNYTSTTVIATSSIVSVASGSAVTLVPFASGQALGDCSNGLEIEIQVACAAITNKNFWFTEWQLEEGTINTSVEYPAFPTVLQQCQRFYEKSYDLASAPGTITNNGSIHFPYISTNRPVYTVRYSVPKRTTVTPTIYNPNSGVSGSIRNFDASSDINSIGINYTGQNGFSINPVVTATTGQDIGFHFVADARL